jgi:hypothetical protein
MLRRNINMDGLSLSRRSAFLTAVLPLSVDEWGSGAFTVGDCAGTLIDGSIKLHGLSVAAGLM